MNEFADKGVHEQYEQFLPAIPYAHFVFHALSLHRSLSLGVRFRKRSMPLDNFSCSWHQISMNI